jgi:hypothetical protein
MSTLLLVLGLWERRTKLVTFSSKTHSKNNTAQKQASPSIQYTHSPTHPHPLHPHTHPHTRNHKRTQTWFSRASMSPTCGMRAPCDPPQPPAFSSWAHRPLLRPPVRSLPNCAPPLPPIMLFYHTLLVFHRLRRHHRPPPPPPPPPQRQHALHLQLLRVRRHKRARAVVALDETMTQTRHQVFYSSCDVDCVEECVACSES